MVNFMFVRMCCYINYTQVHNKYGLFKKSKKKKDNENLVKSTRMLCK